MPHNHAVIVSTIVFSLGACLPTHAQDCCPDDDFGYRLHHHDASARPQLPRGLDTLATIQHVTALLLADPATDWENVSITRLREHLVDLDRLMLGAVVDESAVDGGVDVMVRGDDRTLDAARRVLPVHAERMAGYRSWTVAVEDRGSEVLVQLRARDDDQLQILRAVGFFGFLSSGVYTPHQLLGVARGVDPEVLRPRAGSG